MGKGATTECVPRGVSPLFFLCVFLFIEFLSREYSEGACGVFLSFQKISFFDFFVSSAKVGANHAAKVTPPLSPNTI